MALLISLLVFSAASCVTVVDVNPGDDLDAKVNAAPAGATIQVHGKAGTPLYIYTINRPIVPKAEQTITGDVGTSTIVGPATVPHPSVGIQGTRGIATLFRPSGDNVRITWLDLDATYIQKTVNGLNGGPGVVMQYVVVHDAQGSGIGQYRGKVLDSELYGNGTDLTHLDGVVSGVKCNYACEVARSYFHNNPGNGIWCDVGCQTESGMPNGFYVHDNVVSNNGRHGIIYENSPKPSINWGDVTVKALIQNNIVYGSGLSEISVSDSLNGQVDSNVIGQSLTGELAPSADNVGVELHSSSKLDRGVQRDATISNNVLNGEAIRGTGTDRDGTPNEGCGDNGNVCTNN